MGVFSRDDNADGQSAPIVGTGSVFTASPAKALPYMTHRPLTAAAQQIKIGDKAEFEQFRNRRSANSSAWQDEAWEYYDAIGELKYAFNLVASVVSRIRIYAAIIEDPSEAPISARSSSIIDPQLASAAERALNRLDSAYGGQAGLLRDAALNLSVAGECYLVQTPERLGHGIPESWDIKSVDEVLTSPRGGYNLIGRREQSTGGGLGGQKVGGIELSSSAFVGRIWRAHPRFSDEADSSLRGLLDLCAELLLLNRTFRATARSRLNAGALYLPDGLSVAANPMPDYPYADGDTDLDPSILVEEAQDDFEEQLIDAMTTPIKDEDSASAVVPLIIRGPAELGDKIKQFKFERSFDPALATRADRVLERILQGVDVPKDIVTGLANVKYSNALQIDETLYKTHIEPLMLLISDALTVVYLRPYLIANGYDPTEVDRLVVWYDPSAISTRNDRAADADAGFDKAAISWRTWRDAHGFSEADAPSPDEIAIRMMFEKGMITPELTEAMLGALAPEMMEKVKGAQQAASVGPMPPNVLEALQGNPASATPAEGATPEPEGATPVTAAAGDTCPPATQDIAINLTNRKNAIDTAMYGPLNPAEPNTKYWKALAGEWNVTPAEAKQQRCGNCAVFIQTPSMKACIEGGLTDNADEFEAIDSKGDLGYCEIFDFKCASARTCRAWVAGGPVTEEGQSNA
jgi:hypothetical protein